MNHDDEPFVLDITITVEIPGGWPIGSIALAAIADTLNRLEHDGIRPTHTRIDITETPTH